MAELYIPQIVMAAKKASRAGMEEPVTLFHDSSHDHKTEEPGVGLEPDVAIGTRSTLTGRVNLTPYQFNISLYDEPVRNHPDFTIMEVQVRAGEGYADDEDEGTQDGDGIRGVVTLYPNGGLDADLTHGTQVEQDSSEFASFDTILGYVGLRGSEVLTGMETDLYIPYNTGELRMRLVDGFYRLAADHS